MHITFWWVTHIVNGNFFVYKKTPQGTFKQQEWDVVFVNYQSEMFSQEKYLYNYI